MNKKIIVAEDSNIIQNLLKRILSQIKYDVFCVKNGKQVMELINKKPYDLILMDINMPVMNGIECSQAIRKLDKEWKNIPIFAITGNAADYSEEDYLKLGIDKLIPKPINYDFLVEMIKKQLDDD